MSDCIFCRIINGEAPKSLVYEDDHVIAFDDIAPQAPVHTLIVPKRHVVNLSDDLDHELISAVFAAVPKIAEIKGIAQSGYRVIVNNGPDARQSVFHLHVHVVGGRDMLHRMIRFADE